MGDRFINRKRDGWRYAFLIAMVIILFWMSFKFRLSKDRPPDPLPHEKNQLDEKVLDAIVIPVDDAPEGTYIIEYSNGNKEVLHPDGRRAPLVVSPHKH